MSGTAVMAVYDVSCQVSWWHLSGFIVLPDLREL